MSSYPGDERFAAEQSEKTATRLRLKALVEEDGDIVVNTVASCVGCSRPGTAFITFEWHVGGLCYSCAVKAKSHRAASAVAKERARVEGLSLEGSVSRARGQLACMETSLADGRESSAQGDLVECVRALVDAVEVLAHRAKGSPEPPPPAPKTETKDAAVSPEEYVVVMTVAELSAVLTGVEMRSGSFEQDRFGAGVLAMHQALRRRARHPVEVPAALARTGVYVPTMAPAPLTAERLDQLEKNCMATYLGGHSGEKLEAFQHGMWTAFNVLRGVIQAAEEVAVSTESGEPTMAEVESYLAASPDWSRSKPGALWRFRKEDRWTSTNLVHVTMTLAAMAECEGVTTDEMCKRIRRREAIAEPRVHVPGLVGRCIGRLARVSLWTTSLADAERSRLYWHGIGGDGRAHLTPIGLARTLLRPRGLEVFLVEHEGDCRGVAVEREAPRG